MAGVTRSTHVISQQLAYILSNSPIVLFLPSICHYEQWLHEKLPAHHSLFNTYQFASGAVAKLNPYSLTGCSYCPSLV
jgi:hypothetical protein